MQEVTKIAKDMAHVVVGAGLLGLQKAQVRRVEISKRLDQQLKAAEAQLTDVRSALVSTIETVEARVEPVMSDLEGRFDELETKLPVPAKEMVQQARSLAKEAQVQLKNRLAPVVEKSATKTTSKTKTASATKAKSTAKGKAKKAA